MPTTIRIKKSSTTSAIPVDLEYGELAINYADGKIFFKNSSGIIVSSNLLSIMGSNSFGVVNVDNILVTADSPTDVFRIDPGNNINFDVTDVENRFTINADISPAFDKANSANIVASAAFAVANAAGGTTASEAFDKANSANIIAVAAFETANAASGGDIGPAFDKANSANIIAVAAFDAANTAIGISYAISAGYIFA